MNASPWLVILRSRRILPYALIVLALAVANYSIRGGIRIELNYARPTIVLPFSDILSLMVAFAGAVVLGPRFWEWEITGTRRTRVLAALSAIIVCLAPLVVTIGSDLRNTVPYPWGWFYSNALVLSALTVLLTPLLSPSIAAAVVATCYFGLGVVRSLWVGLSFVPISSFPSTATHFGVGLTLVAAAALLHARLRGSTRWAWHLFLRES